MLYALTTVLGHCDSVRAVNGLDAVQLTT